MGIGLWTTTGIRHLRRTATARPPQFNRTVKPQAPVVDNNGHVTSVSENCNCDHTWVNHRAEEQLGNHYGLLNSKTMGIGLCTTTEI